MRSDAFPSPRAGRGADRLRRKISLPASPPVLDAIDAAHLVGNDGEGEGDPKSLAREALWLGSVVAVRMPDAAEAQALLALMFFTRARRPARFDETGCLVPLEEQDNGLWDAVVLAQAGRALRRVARAPTLGRYRLEAAIAAAHADRRQRCETDWGAIVGLYPGLAALHSTAGALTGPVAALRKAGDPAAGLAVPDGVDRAYARAHQPHRAVRARLAAACNRRDFQPVRSRQLPSRSTTSRTWSSVL